MQKHILIISIVNAVAAIAITHHISLDFAFGAAVGAVVCGLCIAINLNVLRRAS